MLVHGFPHTRQLWSAVPGALATRWRVVAADLRLHPERLLPTLERVGGSAAQRGVMEEARLLGLVREGADARAAELLTERLGRRLSPLDERQLSTLVPSPLGKR